MDVDALFHRLYPALFRYVNRLTGSPDVAEDVAQESFVRLLSRPMEDDEARRWLFTVATNLVRDGARSSKRRIRLMASAPDAGGVEEPMQDRLLNSKETVRQVRETLDALPDRDRVMLLMREEGFRYDEIAEVVGVASGSVGTLLARAAHRFADIHKSQEMDDDTSG
jgi:RNA polymerase sigma-70 factor (ECF subfamily)